MTVQQKRQVTVGVTTAVVGGLLLFFAQKLAGQVVLRNEFDQHMQAEAYAHDKQADAMRRQEELLLDFICETNPRYRRCPR